MEETPNGGTSLQQACPPEELKNSRIQVEFEMKFLGRSIGDLFIIELCAGSAKLSKVAHQCGFRTMAVDHTAARA